MSSHPVTDFANSFFSVQNVLYTPGLFASFSSDLKLSLSEALKISAVKGKYDNYKDEVFRDALNRSETVHINDNYIYLLNSSPQLRICVCEQEQPSTFPMSEIVGGLRIVNIQSVLKKDLIYFDPEQCTENQIRERLIDNKITKHQFEDETLRDCYLRNAFANGLSKEKFQAAYDQYLDKVYKSLKDGKPKGQYEKSTEEFMQESGYPITVKAIEIRAYMQKVYTGELTAESVQMADCCCINHGDLPKKLLTNERPKPKMSIEPLADDLAKY